MINHIQWGGVSSYLSNSRPIEQEELFLAAQGEKPTVEEGALEDEITLSPLARLLSGDENLELLPMMASTENRISLPEVIRAQKGQIADFRENLATALGRVGIKSDRPIRLQVDPSGGIIVTNDHPADEQIEALFEHNQQLANQFRAISATGSLLNAAREAEAFQREYAKNAFTAVELYGHLFNGSDYKPAFQLTLFGEEAGGEVGEVSAAEAA